LPDRAFALAVEQSRPVVVGLRSRRVVAPRLRDVIAPLA
jgi:hypothetical protein